MPDNPISPSGRIRDVRLPTLLQFLRRERKTGILTLRRNDLHKFIYLQEGDIVFASSLYPDDRLGEMLLKAGKIKFDQYEKSVDLLKKTGKRQGTILVEEGMITPKDLFEGVLFQVKEIIASLFTWIDGEYVFDEGPLSSEDVITINMSTANLILEGVRRINDWTRLMNDLPPLDHLLQIATDPRDLFQTVNMASLERDVMRQVDGRRSLRDILTLSSIPSMECAKVLYFLIAIGILRAEAPLSSQPAAEGPSAQKKSDSGSTAEKEKIEKTEKGEEMEALKEAVLEEERPSTRQKIHEAYLSLEKQNYYQSLHLPKTATREEVKRAYFTLAKEYHPDRHFEPGMEEIKKELEALFIKIKEAYDTLASEGKRKAYDLELVSGKSPRKESAVVVTPRDLFAQGEEALRRGDLRNACYFFKEAIEKAPEKIENSTYYLRYGQTLSRVPGKLREAAEVLRKGIALDPTRLDFFMELGSIYHKTGLTQKAIAAFSEVLKRDPDHQKAKEEIEKLQASFP